MAKIFRYKDFQVDEAMGVSPSFKYTEEFSDMIMDVAKQSFAHGQPEFQEKFELPGEDIKTIVAEFPIKFVEMQASCTMLPSGKELFVEGVYSESSLEIDEDQKISFMIGINITISAQMIVKIMKGDEVVLKKLKTEIESTVSHELTHAYEDYMRSKNKKMNILLDDTKDYLFDMVANKMMKHGMPNDIANFLFNLYTCASYEVNARVAQSYSLVKDIKDTHQRWEIIKASVIYKVADDLEKFDAQKTYNKIYKNLVKEEVDKEEIDLVLKKFMQVLYESFLKANSTLKNNIGRRIMKCMTGPSASDDSLEKISKIISVIDRHGEAIVKEVGNKDLLGFMKMWEKKFHHTGADMKYRLGKITTLEL